MITGFYRSGEWVKSSQQGRQRGKELQGQLPVQINISIRHGHLSAETQGRLSAKLEKLSRFHDRITSVNATIELEHPDSPHVEVRISAERRDDFVATDQSDNLIGSLDAVIHKLEQQLRKHKERITDRRHSGGKVQRSSGGAEEAEGEIDQGGGAS